MIDENTLTEALDIILERILTPVIYMYDDEVTEFICFTDENITDDDFSEAEAALFINLGISAEIMDIRNFEENERIEIMDTARLVYSEDELLKMLVENALIADFERLKNINKDALIRKTETGTYYAN